MKRCSAIIGGVLFLVIAAAGALAQDSTARDFFFVGAASMHAPYDDAPALEGHRLSYLSPALDIVVPPVSAGLPRMSPELALTAYLGFAQQQLKDLGAYSDATTIEADLPDTAQHGKFELRRSYRAPRTLAFAAVHFAGDGFVKTNVIARLLQSEVEHVQKGEGALTAITADNYKFGFKAVEVLDDHLAYLYQIKPKHKRMGLFKGRILIDAATGHLRRAEGTMVKAPSFFVKKIEFVQDYADFGPFSLPTHVHSVAKTRLVGRAVVDIDHERYQAKSVAQVQSENGASGSAGAGSGASSTN
ncbi:MAG: hypothetical protein LAO06_03395 [Acidobacteriia bacterium]|nr:hypothetical protein [Terriglobia bacterium]